MNRLLTPSLSPSEGERVPEGRVRGWIMVPMHAEKRKGASHEPGGARLRRALISNGYIDSPNWPEILMARTTPPMHHFVPGRNLNRTTP